MLRTFASGLALLVLAIAAIAIVCLVIFFPFNSSVGVSSYATVLREQSPEGTIYCGGSQQKRTMQFMNLFLRQKAVGFENECRTGMAVMVASSDVAAAIRDVEGALVYTKDTDSWTVQPGIATEEYRLYTILLPLPNTLQ